MCVLLKIRPAALARTACTIGLLAFSGLAWGQTVEDTITACTSASTKLPLMTYDEEVQAFADPACRTNFLDSIQFIPLNGENENYYLSFGFWIRERGEYASNPNCLRQA